ncbi:MAG: RodZ domain-containing protein [Atribacterota bacterium]
MKDIGNFLKGKREAKGISLNEVEKDLKIRKRYLQALEDGNVNIIPGKAYIVGYLRNYSKYLGIDEEDINSIIQTYKDIEKQKGVLQDIKEENVFLKKKDRSILFDKKRVFFPYKYIYLVSFILIIFVGLLWINHSLKEAQNIPVPSPEIETEADLNVMESTNETSTLTEEVSETSIEESIEETLLTEDIIIDKTPTLRIIASNNTWVKILHNDEIVFERILFKGEEICWQSKQSLNLITEYPAQIEAYYNEEEVEINKGITKNNILKYSFTPM